MQCKYDEVSFLQHLPARSGKARASESRSACSTPTRMVAWPPEFGEQTDEVLAGFGFTADEIGSLRQAEVV